MFFLGFLMALEPDEYCLELDEVLDCRICVLSYIENGRCVKPQNQIPYCLMYKSEDKC